MLSCAALAALIVAMVICQREPIGYFNSYKLMPHADDDVLHFTNGIVSYETCCGDTLEGYYRRTTNSTWVWDRTYRRKSKVTNDIAGVIQISTRTNIFTNQLHLEPGLFGLTVVDDKGKRTVWLRRAFFPPTHN